MVWVMNPISNEKFSDDYNKFVLQVPDVHIVHKHPSSKPFDLGPPKKSKSKKDSEKQKKNDDTPKDSSK